uniref:Uncharacterized protein n=1 Tax=Sipha flava TaxID=143950 RepID=A0A2S2Q151_9HEMI
MYGLREDHDTRNRLVAAELQLVGGLTRRHHGWHHGGRIEHTTGHGLLDLGQRRAHRWTVYGRVPGARVQHPGHVATYLLGRTVRHMPDDGQSGVHVRLGHDSGSGRIYQHGSGHGRHHGGRFSAAAHVRVSAGHAEHHTVRDVGQRLHRLRGRHRDHVAAERVAGRGHGPAERAVASGVHVLRFRGQLPHDQLDDGAGLRGHHHHSAGVQRVPEGQDQQEAVHAVADRTVDHGRGHDAVSDHQHCRGLQHDPDGRDQIRAAGHTGAAAEAVPVRVPGRVHHSGGRVLDIHVAGAAGVGEAQVPDRHKSRAAGAGHGQRDRVAAVVPAVRRVAVAQRVAADGGRQDADGQHRVGRHHRGGAAVGGRGVRAVAAVRVVQHHRGRAQGHRAADVGAAQDLEELAHGRPGVADHVRRDDRAGHRRGPADRRAGVRAVRVRQRRADRRARARPVARHRPVHAAGHARRRGRGAGRQGAAVRGQRERHQPVRVQAEDRRGAALRVRRGRAGGQRRAVGSRAVGRAAGARVAHRRAGHGRAPVLGRGRHQAAVRTVRISGGRRLRRVAGRRARRVDRLHARQRAAVRAVLPDRARRGRVPPAPAAVPAPRRRRRQVRERRAKALLTARPARPVRYLIGTRSSRIRPTHLTYPSSTGRRRLDDLRVSSRGKRVPPGSR